MKVSTILSTKQHDVITIRPEETVKTAVATLTKHNIGALIVVDDAGQLTGILSERDVIRVASETDDVLTLTVADVMTRDVITGTPQDDVMSVASTMTEKRFRHLPIVKDNELIGIVSIGDLMKAQRDQYRGERNTLETQIMADE